MTSIVPDTLPPPNAEKLADTLEQYGTHDVLLERIRDEAKVLRDASWSGISRTMLDAHAAITSLHHQRDQTVAALRADRATLPVESRHIDRDELWALFVDHYWDSLAKDRDLILCHISSVLMMTPPAELTSGQLQVTEKKEGDPS